MMVGGGCGECAGVVVNGLMVLWCCGLDDGCGGCDLYCEGR